MYIKFPSVPASCLNPEEGYTDEDYLKSYSVLANLQSRYAERLYLLLFALQYRYGKAGKWFNVSNEQLLFMGHMAIRGLRSARNELIDSGLIQYKSGSKGEEKNCSGRYKIMPYIHGNYYWVAIPVPQEEEQGFNTLRTTDSTYERGFRVLHSLHSRYAERLYMILLIQRRRYSSNTISGLYISDSRLMYISQIPKKFFYNAKKKLRDLDLIHYDIPTSTKDVSYFEINNFITGISFDDEEEFFDDGRGAYGTTYSYDTEEIENYRYVPLY